MVAPSSFLPNWLVAALIFSFAAVSLASTFSDDNPIRIVSEGLPDFQSSAGDAVSSTSFLSSRSTIDAIYQFGDSISDTGNFICEVPLSEYTRLPYGLSSLSFFHRPTGRPSNGLLMIDYFSKYFNLPFLDPYLKKDGNFSHGVNFAVAGATALNTSTLAMKGIGAPKHTNSSLLVQLDWFKAHLNSICSSISECKEKFGRSLIVMGEIGGNDYNRILFQGKCVSKGYDLVLEVVQLIKYVIKEIINLGAIRIVVPGNFPVGCMTINLVVYKTNDSRMYDEHQCLQYLNEFAEFHNNKLKQVIRELEKDHPHVKIVYADYYSALKEILKHPTSFGFDEDAMQKVCCGIGNNEYNFDVDRRCGSEEAVVCEHPNQHLFWDGIHLTQQGYQIMANFIIEHSFQGIFTAA